MKTSKIIPIILSTARQLNFDKVTLREIEALNFENIKPLTPAQIKMIREREKLSQTVMAKILNVTPSTYQKWERGAVIPRGANLKLLRVVEANGIEHIL